MTEKEIQKIMHEMGDERLVKELRIGCDNKFEQGYARCPYNQGHCTKGAFLTSTLLEAHPSDCPLWKEYGNGKQERDGRP